MSKNHEGMIKGFYHTSKAFYGESSLKGAEYKDEVLFGMYEPADGSTTGEMSVTWSYLGKNIVSQLSVYSDAWSALSQFHELIDILGEHDGENPTPEQFCEYLLEAGFIDMTPVKNPYERLE